MEAEAPPREQCGYSLKQTVPEFSSEFGGSGHRIDRGVQISQARPLAAVSQLLLHPEQCDAPAVILEQPGIFHDIALLVVFEVDEPSIGWRAHHFSRVSGLAYEALSGGGMGMKLSPLDHWPEFLCSFYPTDLFPFADHECHLFVGIVNILEGGGHQTASEDR